jgi:hypothetical protein
VLLEEDVTDVLDEVEVLTLVVVSVVLDVVETLDVELEEVVVWLVELVDVVEYVTVVDDDSVDEVLDVVYESEVLLLVVVSVTDELLELSVEV